jgi:hypothetical protein
MSSEYPVISRDTLSSPAGAFPAALAAAHNWSVVGLGISTALSRYSAVARHVNGVAGAWQKNG